MTREEAIKHLRDDWYINNGQLCVDGDNKDSFFAAVGMGIKALNAVPVVRCKDCEHYLSKSAFCGCSHGIRCDVAPDWYCSNGQRRGSEQDG